MADQDLNIGNLSDEQLAVYKELLTKKAFDEQARATPGPPTAPKPMMFNAGLASMLPKVLGGGLPLMADPNADETGTPDEQKARLNPFGSMGSRMMSGPGQGVLPTPGELAGYLPGGNFMRLINGATTRTGADLGTATALSGAIPLLGGKAATKGLNTLWGAAKGAGLYEGGNQIHAALSGEEQPSLDPRQRSPLDLGLGAIFTAIGGKAGANEIPESKKPLDLAREKWTSYQQQQANLSTQAAQHDTQLNALEVSAKEALAERNAAKRSADDARRQVGVHEKEMDAAKEAAATTERKNFLAAQDAFKEQEKSLAFEIKNGQAKGKDLAEQAATHQASLSTQQTQDAAQALRQKQADFDTVRQKLAAELDAIQKDAASIGNKTPGLKNQALNNIANKKTEISAFEGNAKKEIDALKAATKTEAGTTPANSEAATKKLLELHMQLSDNNAALEELNKRYQTTVLDRLSHAKTAQGATTIDVSNLDNARTLKQSAEDAMAQHKEMETRVDQLAIEKARTAHEKAKVKEASAKLAENAPTKPADEASGKMNTFVDFLKKKAAPALVGAGIGAGSHSAGSLMSIGPIAGSLLGAGAATALNSEAGHRFRQMLGAHVSPTSLRAIPSFVNIKSRLLPDKQ